MLQSTLSLYLGMVQSDPDPFGILLESKSEAAKSPCPTIMPTSSPVCDTGMNVGD